MAQETVKSHMRVFAVLVVLTLVSAGAAMAGIGASAGIFLALGIACVQVFLVSRYLLHVRQEKKPIQILLGFTAFFVVILFVLEIAARYDRVEGSEFIASPTHVEDAEASDTESEH